MVDDPIRHLNRLNQITARSLRRTKALRVLRRFPTAAWEEFQSPLADRSQVLAFMNAVIATYLILQTASLARMAEEAESWALAVQAFAFATLLWSIIAMIRAPFVIIAKDRATGRWHENHFVYHDRLLVATERFEALDGSTQKRLIFFDDVEPASFVYYRCELTPDPSPRVTVFVTGGQPNEHMDLVQPGQTNWGRYVGIRLPEDRAATLMVRMLPDTVPVICRVYCHSFYVGKDDKTYVK